MSRSQLTRGGGATTCATRSLSDRPTGARGMPRAPQRAPGLGAPFVENLVGCYFRDLVGRRTRNAPNAISAAPSPRRPVVSPVFVDGRLETPATAEPLCGAVCTPATAVFLLDAPLLALAFALAFAPVDGAVCTEATTPFGPNPRAQVIAPAGITVVVVVTVGSVGGVWVWGVGG